MIFVRLTFVLAAVLFAVVMLKVVFAVAILGALAFVSLYTFNLARRLLRGNPLPRAARSARSLRRVTPLAGPRITARR